MPRRALTIAAAILSLCWAATARAQQHDGQLWLQSNVNIPVDDGLRVTLEQIARFSDRQEGLYQTELGVLLSVKVAPGVELGGGYRRVGFYNRNTAADEDRLRQQVVATFGAVTTRFRVDERFHTRQGGVGIRIRPLLRYNYKLGPKGTALFYSHESFFLPNSTRWGQRSGYERMRNIVGFAFPLSRGISADLGYLNQFRPGRAGGRDQMEHALNFQISFNLDEIGGPHVDD